MDIPEVVVQRQMTCDRRQTQMAALLSDQWKWNQRSNDHECRASNNSEESLVPRGKISDKCVAPASLLLAI